MVEREFLFLTDKKTPLLPSGELRDEVRRRSKLDVYFQRFFQRGEGAKELIVLGEKTQIHIDSARSPVQKNGGCSTGEINSCRDFHFLTERAHELLDSFRVSYLAHSAARSKLTSLRTREL